MKNFSALSLIMFFLAFMAGCNSPEVTPTADQAASEAAAKKSPTNTGTLKNINVTGVLPNGGTFTGKVTITKFSYDATGGLLVDGFVKGTANGSATEIVQKFQNVEATLANGAAAGGRVSAECQILFLDLGPIFLDLLGLQLDLSRIVLDLTAVSGAGNLLGNLLCAVAGLLDGATGLLALLSNLNQLLDLLNQINQLLG